MNIEPGQTYRCVSEPIPAYSCFNPRTPTYYPRYCFFGTRVVQCTAVGAFGDAKGKIKVHFRNEPPQAEKLLSTGWITEEDFDRLYQRVENGVDIPNTPYLKVGNHYILKSVPREVSRFEGYRRGGPSKHSFFFTILKSPTRAANTDVVVLGITSDASKWCTPKCPTEDTYGVSPLRSSFPVIELSQITQKYYDDYFQTLKKESTPGVKVDKPKYKHAASLNEDNCIPEGWFASLLKKQDKVAKNRAKAAAYKPRTALGAYMYAELASHLFGKYGGGTLSATDLAVARDAVLFAGPDLDFVYAKARIERKYNLRVTPTRWKSFVWQAKRQDRKYEIAKRFMPPLEEKPSINQCGTQTGRFSCSDPNISSEAKGTFARTYRSSNGERKEPYDG